MRIGRVDPEIPIAEAWNRLINGSFIPSDIRLLEHEYFESKFEKIFKTILRQAHDRTEDSRRVWKP